jgi:hypothetical protein
MSNINQSTLQGKVTFVGQEQQITANMAKREIVVEYQRGNRIEQPKVEFINPTNVFDRIQVGQEVLITFYPCGNQSKTDPSKFFVSLVGVNLQILN